jgi:hypothetical protein
MGFQITRRAVLTAGFALAAGSIQPLHAQAIIRGTLYDDATGSPIRGTVMLVDPASDAPVVHVVSDSLGQFLLQAGDGTYQLAAVRDGYGSVLSAPIPLVNGERMTIRLPMAHDGDPVHKIGVLEHIRPNLSQQRASTYSHETMRGFDARRTVGEGLQYDRSQLERSNAQTLGEFLQNVPGLSVDNPEHASGVQMSRSANMGITGAAPGTVCHVGWFVDGHRMDLPGQSLDAVTDGLGDMQLDALEGLEIFRGLSEMPSEFAAPDLRCGAIAIWTRRG